MAISPALSDSPAGGLYAVTERRLKPVRRRALDRVR